MSLHSVTWAKSEAEARTLQSQGWRVVEGQKITHHHHYAVLLQRDDVCAVCRVEFAGEEDRLIAEIDGKDALIHPGCIFEATPCSK